MPVRRGKDGRWRYRESIQRIDGSSERVSGTAPTYDNTKTAALRELRSHIHALLDPGRVQQIQLQEVVTFGEWFKGRFWREWVIGRKNKPSEMHAKETIFRCHLEPRFGSKPLDAISVSDIANLRADLLERGLSEKRINNILLVLSKALRYAVDCELISKVPSLGLFRVERPEIVAWDFAEYGRILAAARADSENWYAAVCLAGEAGLRVGEIKALRWREDVDMTARLITVRHQTCYGITTTPKGRTRRTVPMTDALHEALSRMSAIREGYVVRNEDGSQKRDGEADHAIARICRLARLPVRYWHTLRHSFGTHAALCGVNPWRLQTWLGHKRVDETMLYVHVASEKPIPLPHSLIQAGATEVDPDRRVLAMLGARGKILPRPIERETKTIEVSVS